MQTHTVIRQATPEDAEAICSVRDKAWIDAYPNHELGITAADIELNAKGPNGQFVPKRIAWLEQKIAAHADDWIAYVATIDGVVIGCVIASIEDGGRHFLNSLYVEPQQQGMGVGGELMRVALRWLGPEHDVYLEVLSYNEDAKRFYHRVGFAETGNPVPSEQDAPDYIVPLPQLEMVLRAGEGAFASKGQL